MRQAQSALRKLNPAARQLSTSHAKVAFEDIVGTELFKLEQAQSSAAWHAELIESHTPETEEYGISSFDYRARRPFHPARLARVLERDWPGVLRAKGFCWLASRHNEAIFWSQAGTSLALQGSGSWWASDPSQGEQEPEDEAYLASVWQEPFGDRRQELVLIGVGMNVPAITKSLDSALLKDGEMARGPEAWERFPDPLPRRLYEFSAERFLEKEYP